MKLRLGYVSNSSSSSFFIIGEEFERDDIVELMDRHNKRDDYDPPEFVEECLYEICGLEGAYDYEQEIGYIGLQFYRMDDDETKSQFFKRIAEGLKKLTGKDIEPKEILTEVER